MASAKPPGSISTATKMITETTNSVIRPKPSRCNTILRTTFIPCDVPYPASGSGREAGRTAGPRPVPSPILREPPAGCDLHSVDVPVRGNVAVGDGVAVGAHIIVEHDDHVAA